MKANINYIKRRIKLLKGTAKELKQEFKRSKTPILEDLYLEILCYCNEINSKLKIAERRKK